MTEIEFLSKILTDTKVKISEEFDRNFERKAFFDKKWSNTKLINRRGSLMMRTGKLRRGNIATISGSGISWKNSMPQAQLMNEGGKVKVTERMKKFFWAMYYKSSGAITEKKNGEVSNSQRNQRLSLEAQQWKNLALQKVGSTMNVEQRQFIGDHPQIDKFVREIINSNFKELSASWAKKNGFK